MYSYETVVEAVQDLKRRGYTVDFNLGDDQTNETESPAHQIVIHPDAFEIRETHRFEGMSDPNDSAVVYAIEAQNGVKGILVNGYGIYDDPSASTLIADLPVRHED